MAQRRMFSKSITNSSRFLMMPQSSQNLYFHIGMNADDDGFCEHFTIMRMTESKPDDLKILQAKQFIQVFDDHVLIILDWKENNQIRSDRYTPSKYLEIYQNEIKQISMNSGIPDVIPTGNQMEPQFSIGKVSLDKNNKESKSHCNPDGLPLKQKKETKIYFKQYSAKQMTDKYIMWFEEICNQKPECYVYDWKALFKIIETMERDYFDRYNDNIDQMFIDLLENIKNINSIYEKASEIWKVMPRPSIIYKYINEIKQYINLKIEKDERYGNR